MENSVKERLKLFLKKSNIKAIDFCRSIDVSSGFISGMRESIQPDKLKSIAINYPILDIGWLMTGEGSMLKSNSSYNMKQYQLNDSNYKPVVREEEPTYYVKAIQTRPRIPYTAAAGSLTNAVAGITSDQCEQIPRINAFPDYDFTIILKGDSMEPKYEGGDEVACKRIDSTSFIQWGKVHVLDTAQGIIIKRIYEDGEKIRCASYNTEYPDFSILKEEIFSMSLVVGLIRL